MLFSRPTRNQLIALAGVFQACELVDALARLGTCDSESFETSIHSLFEQNPPSTEAVFGGVSHLDTGILAMGKILNLQKNRQPPETLRYVLGVLYLQKKLTANRDMLHHVGEGIDNAARQAAHFSETHPNVIANLADLYQRTISTFKFRIQVNGMPQHLQQPAIANKIRCLLFAGIRAAVLWHQVGGRRRHLIFNRNDILDGIRDLRRTPRT